MTFESRLKAEEPSGSGSSTLHHDLLEADGSSKQPQLLTTLSRNRGQAKRRPPSRQKLRAEAAKAEENRGFLEEATKETNSADQNDHSTFEKLEANEKDIKEPRLGIPKLGNAGLISELKFKFKPEENSEPIGDDKVDSNILNDSQNDLLEKATVDLDNPIVGKTEKLKITSVDKSSKENAESEGATRSITPKKINSLPIDNSLEQPSVTRPSLEKEASKSSKSAKMDKLSDNSDSDEDLFAPPPVPDTIKKISNVKTDALFDSSNSSDEDLFSSPSGPSTRPSLVNNAPKGTPSKISSTKLFEDSDDSDDDLFGLTKKSPK